MWFLFGLITLISFSIYFGLKRYENRWNGLPRNDGRTQHEVKFFFYKEKTKSFLVATSAPREFDFAFKRETGVDRFCKAVGLSVEHQLGIEKFDKLVYVVSNDHHFLQDVVSNQEVVEAVTSLFSYHENNCRITSVRCTHGWLIVSVKVMKDGQAESHLNKFNAPIALIAERLKQISSELKRNRPKSNSKFRDKFIVRAAILLAMSTGLFVNGMIHSFRTLLGVDSFTVDLAQLGFLACVAGFAMVGALVVAVFYLLGRSARTHLVLIEILIVGSIGATLTAFIELRELNMEFDGSSANYVATEVMTKEVTHSRRSGYRYYVTVKGWTNEEASRKLAVNRDFYLKTQVGQTIGLNQHKGALGVRWVSSYTH